MAGFYVDRGLTSNRIRENGRNEGNAYVTTSIAPSIATPAEVAVANAPTTPSVVIQNSVPGFGSYLDGIVPPDIATAAGAFSASMQQIKNISSIPVEKFAQVVINLETTKGLNVNGTNVPTDTTLAQQGLNLIALGNGPFGTYTMSNFLGCMSGLPYIGINIRQYIQELETPTLYSIYKNLYLAVTWERATVYVDTTSYQVEVSPGDYVTYYHVTGLTLTDAGGGYGREGASAPVITISNGGSGTTTIGTSYTNIGASGSYGRVTSVSLSSAGSDSTSVPTATVDYPPGTGSFSNSIVQSYIDAANAEILVIKNSQPAKAQQLITNWEKTGTLLSIEQRAISTGLPIDVPLASNDDREPTLAGYPTTQYSFVDSIPQYAAATQPHMYSQTLEAISNLNTLGGRSLVGMLRQSRNQARLTKLGIPLDNNIEDTLTTKQQAQLIGNGSLPNSVPATNGVTPITGEFVDSPTATLAVLDPGATLGAPLPFPASDADDTNSPDPYGYYNPIDNTYYNTNILFGTIGSASAPDALRRLGVSNTGTGSSGGSITGADGGSIIGAVAGGGSGAGAGTPIDIGKAIEPGSFAGSRYQNLISPELSVIYTSDVLLPATYSVQEAIDEVIRCNCDCWDNI